SHVSQNERTESLEKGVDDSPSAPEDANEDALPDGCALLHTSAKEQTVPGVLRNLRRTVEELYLDRGVSVLHLAFGLLHWKSVDGTELCSPLLLVPVTLEARSAYHEPRLVEGEDDEVLNPALKLLLEERGADLGNLPDPEGATFSEITDEFKAILETIGGLGEWRIDNSVHIGKFTFTKEAMYRDLLENEERVLAHPIVRALATTDPTVQTSEFLFDGIDPSEVDRLAPEEGTPLVLDADSSQRDALATTAAPRILAELLCEEQSRGEVARLSPDHATLVLTDAWLWPRGTAATHRVGRYVVLLGPSAPGQSPARGHRLEKLSRGPK